MFLDNDILNKYYINYIDGISIDNIEYKVFTYEELQDFLRMYYYDYELEQYVCWEEDGFFPLYGMYYLENSSDIENLSCLLGITNNSNGGKTIAFSMLYDESYQNLNNDKEKISYIITIETNYFFRNRGIFKKSLNYIKELFKNNDVVVISLESSMGILISLRQRMVNLFSDIDVDVKGWEDVYSLVKKK